MSRPNDDAYPPPTVYMGKIFVTLRAYQAILKELNHKYGYPHLVVCFFLPKLMSIELSRGGGRT